jgi:hypothetical protein
MQELPHAWPFVQTLQHCDLGMQFIDAAATGGDHESSLGSGEKSAESIGA